MTMKGRCILLVAGVFAVTLSGVTKGQDQTPTATTNVVVPTSSSSIKFEGTDLHIGNLPPIAFHGFASQGFLYSSDYNYLGDTSDGSLKYGELGLNAMWSPCDRTRIAIQGFAFDVGDVGRYYPILDYASIEYTFDDTIGIRVGRIRRPGGIYNSIQDVDLARTSKSAMTLRMVAGDKSSPDALDKVLEPTG